MRTATNHCAKTLVHRGARGPEPPKRGDRSMRVTVQGGGSIWFDSFFTRQQPPKLAYLLPRGHALAAQRRTKPAAKE